MCINSCGRVSGTFEIGRKRATWVSCTKGPSLPHYGDTRTNYISGGRIDGFAWIGGSHVLSAGRIEYQWRLSGIHG